MIIQFYTQRLISLYNTTKYAETYYLQPLKYIGLFFFTMIVSLRLPLTILVCLIQRFPMGFNFQGHYSKYAPAASAVIRQFLNSFSTPFSSCRHHQTTLIYIREDTDWNAVYCMSILEILQILWDFEF